MRNGFEVSHTMNLTDFGHLSDDGDAGEDKMTKGLKREVPHQRSQTQDAKPNYTIAK